MAPSPPNARFDITRLAFALVFIILAIPIALLLLGVGLIAALFAIVVWGVRSAWARVRGLFGPGDGRENVRVIARD